MRRNLLRSSAFARELKKWLKSRPEAAGGLQAVLEQLAADAAHPSLRSHKLRGPLAGCWSCSSGYDLRIVYEFVTSGDEEAILLLGVGTHDVVY